MGIFANKGVTHNEERITTYNDQPVKDENRLTIMIDTIKDCICLVIDSIITL